MRDKKKLNWLDQLNSERVNRLNSNLIIAIRKIGKALKDAVSTLANIPHKNKKEIRLYQTKWPPIRDTRLKSQVLHNKPKHLIKKVIR